MIRKSDNHPNRERGGERKEQKKRPKIGKDPLRGQKVKKPFFLSIGSTLPRPPSLPKRLLGLPFGPQTRPDSGYPSDI
jgi:hypothetical protein